ncbi:O-GlcNAc transferase [Baffinella frigidus]|nr:O-GlcNAc transferase [Cryptophyta sp. CCMP2293]
MRRQYALHDRARVEIWCYACQGDDGSEPRAVIKNGCDKFVEAAGWGHQRVAEKIKADGINVLVDLTGYTLNTQTEVMAIGPAPIQVSFHGFPGTMGADFIHYLVADRRTASPDHQEHFTERLMLVPHTYLTNDHKFSRREALLAPGDPLYAQQAPSLAEFGFEESDIILCSFNQLYKIEPEVFGVWMDLLKAEPRAKLWLLRFSIQGAANLQKQAEKAGVDPNRIVAHDQFPRAREFRIKSLAHLFLDTPLFNGLKPST